MIENLINVGSLDRGFAVDYGSFGADGRYVRRRFDFKLLVELAGPDGEVYLRASDEAINVLVGALDTDVESAQIAAEVKLENLISRGLLGDARLAAEQARYRTVQYAEALRQKLDATRRDVRSVDWLAAVPALLDEALTHIEGRYRAETAILDHIATARDEATEPSRRRQAAELVDVVRDCIQRHTQLQTRLQEAGAVFRAEQDRQQFAGGRAARRSTCSASSCGPASRCTSPTALEPTAAFFRAGTGVRVPSVPSLGGLVETLLAPPSDRDPLGEPVPVPELAPAAPDPFGADRWGRVDAALNAALPAAGRAVRLSALLAEARAADPDLPRLVALRVLHAVGSAVATARTQGDARAAAGRRRRHGAARRRVRRSGPARRHGGGAGSYPGTRSVPAVDVESAARLVAHGMRPKALPARDPAYADLVRRYREDDVFADTVQRVASGLGLVVLAVGPASGLVLAAVEDSVFEIRMDEYARRTVLANRQADKVMHGLAHLAVAALAFPRADDLADDTYVGRVSVDQVDGAVREACRTLSERVAGTAEADPVSDAPQLEEVWRAWLRRPEATATKDGRAGEATTRGIVGKALRFLADQGFLVPVGPDGVYRTTPRYQVQVRELAAQRTFDELLALGVLPAAGADSLAGVAGV